MRSPSTGRVEVPFSARFYSVRSGRNPDGAPVGGLRMSRAFAHRPVMLAEVLQLFEAVPPGVLMDATAGAAGHSAALLEAFSHLRIVALDQDPEAVSAARQVLAPFGARARVVHARFDRAGAVLDDLGVGLLSGALFDLGVSSPQFDRPERGFSYRQEGPLDMRMDPSLATSAYELVNRLSASELGALFAANGEERFAVRISRAIVAARPIETTTQLAEVVGDAVPAPARRRGHPARRVFQALRIAVNQELSLLPGALDVAVDRLVAGGRCVVLSYHSGEDRIVKQQFASAASGGCVCPPGLPCVCGATPAVRLLNRGARKPTAAELEANPRSGSARLRAVERLARGGIR